MLSRRKLLTLAAATTVFPTTALFPAKTFKGGWTPNEEAQRAFETRPDWRASMFDGDIRGTGRNKVVRLWKLWERVSGTPFMPHFQEIGDCVSQSMALGLETQAAVQVASGEEDATWEGKISTEALYIAARIEVGQGALGVFDGCTGSWMAEAAEKYGVLPRADYGKGFDVSKYNPGLARSLSASPPRRRVEGIPKWLEPVMAERKLGRAVRIDQGYDQAADYVANGYPIMLCSSVGYYDGVDSDGYLRMSLEMWNHAMLLWGIDTRSRRQGGNIANSWGNNWYPPGTTHKYGCPAGCFWADRDNIDLMLSEGDSYAIIEYRGLVRRDKLNRGV